MQLDRVNQHRLAGAVPALSGVLSLALVANPIADAIAVALLLGGLGYSAAVQALAGWTRDKEREFARRAAVASQLHDSRAAKLKAERDKIERQKNAIATQIKQVEHRAATYETELKTAFDAEIVKATRLLGDKANERITALEQEYAEKIEAAEAQKLARIKKHKSQHRAYERQLHARVAELEKMVVEHDEYLKAEYNRLFDQTDAVLAGEIKGVKTAKQQALAEIHERDLIIERLKGIVTANAAPKKFRGASADDQIANQVIDILLGAGIKVNGDNWDRKYHQLILWVESEAAVTLEIESQLERIQLALGLYNRPTVVIDRGLYKITLDTDAKGTATSKIQITNPPLSRLEAALNASIHIRVAAPSNSGKSVFLGNLINYLVRDYPEGYEASDPKVTEPENWGEIKPQHLGDECLGHLFNLIPSVMDRVNQVKDAIRSDALLPNFDPQFHVFDELELLYGLAEVSPNKDHTPKAFKNNVKLMLKAGREHKLKLLCVTQSPLPSDINLRKNDFFNTSSLLLGNCISEALNDSDSGALMSDVPGELKARLRAEYKARLSEVNELKKGKPDDFRVPQEFIYLFFNPARPHDVFMGLCPPPGHYSTALAKTEVPQNAPPSTVQPLVIESGKAIAVATVQTCTAKSAATTKSAAATTTVNLPALLKAGTYCPQCGTHTNAYAKKKPNGKGNVFPRCKNSDCETNSFKWEVIKQ